MEKCLACGPQWDPTESKKSKRMKSEIKKNCPQFMKFPEKARTLPLVNGSLNFMSPHQYCSPWEMDDIFKLVENPR